MDYNQLSKQFQSFYYDAFYYKVNKEQLELSFDYRLIGENHSIAFKHKVTYFIKGDIHINLELVQDFENFVFHIGLVETINYWKLACPKELIVKCGYLDQNQMDWWKKLFYHGLGEFIYLNGIANVVNENNFIQIICDYNSQDKDMYQLIKIKTSGNLIPIGGGKDSVVTLEVLRESSNIPFVMSPPQAAYDCISVAGYKGYLESKRIFDKRMITMNNEGYLNGHVPFSAILAFISTLGAALLGKKFIPLSNERSANEPSVLGTTFNHQYSKSYEFEQDFDRYLHVYMTEDISYFSLLRPLYEIQIGEMFSHYKPYHIIYRSCNRGKSENIWCGVCAKCLFVFIILSPYVPRDELIKQFNKDLLDDAKLIPLFDELIGMKETKPFECVGTIWEVRHAINLTLQKFTDAALLQYYISINGPNLTDEPSEYEEGDLVPKEHLKRLKREMNRIGIS